MDCSQVYLPTEKAVVDLSAVYHQAVHDLSAIYHQAIYDLSAIHHMTHVYDASEVHMPPMYDSSVVHMAPKTLRAPPKYDVSMTQPKTIVLHHHHYYVYTPESSIFHLQSLVNSVFLPFHDFTDASNQYHHTTMIMPCMPHCVAQDASGVYHDVSCNVTVHCDMSCVDLCGNPCEVKWDLNDFTMAA